MRSAHQHAQWRARDPPPHSAYSGTRHRSSYAKIRIVGSRPVRADQLQEAIELRDERRMKRRREEAERRREILRQNIAHLRRGIGRWRWREQAREFLVMAKAEAQIRGITSPDWQEWFAWAERYVEARGLEKFFAPWLSQRDA